MSDLEKLAGLKKSLPFKGKGSNSKLRGCCPRCGSHSAYRYWTGRFKSCGGCGYDRFYERCFDVARSMAKRGQQFSGATLKQVLGYHSRVYG